MARHRKEKDVIGNINVPENAYYGAFTVRADNNFQISGIRAPEEFKKALGLIKKSAAQTNMELGELQTKHAQATIKAADEFISGKYDDQFTLDVFQAGAGTPFNMNANEIIANRANEILGNKKGTYSPITPNNHVNWGQSSNDVIPTAIRIAALFKLRALLPEVEKLSKSFQKKGSDFKDILKIGRTHLQDAVPITLGQEFQSYGSAIRRSHKYIKDSFTNLNEVHIGGTALGTGITTHPNYRKLMTKNLGKLTKLKLTPTKNPMELTNNMNPFLMASNSLKVLANDLIRISNDLIIMNSGPAGGLNEISLPEVEPGSSIMPGKINPSIAECIAMVGYQIIGNDSAIEKSVQSAHLELNVMTPVIMHNLLWSIDLLTNACMIFGTKCVDKIKANTAHCKKLLDDSLCLATGLSPYLGYKVTAQLVKEAQKSKKTLHETVASKKFMKDKELKDILSLKKLTSPSITDKTLIRRIKRNKEYQSYLKKT